MQPIWFEDGPQPRRVGSVDGEYPQLIHVEADGTGWAVVQQAVRSWQLDSDIDFVATPGGLAHLAAYALDSNQARLPSDVRRGILHRDTPIDPTAAIGDLTHLEIDGQITLAHRQRYGDATFIVAIHDGAWVGVLSPREAPRLSTIDADQVVPRAV